MSDSTAKAVVLAAGRGTRMRAAGSPVELSDAQQRAADAGLKPLIPFDGEPFLGYVLTGLADAGCRDVCIVTGPGNDPVRTYCEQIDARRVRLHVAVQHEPHGSAHALLAAEDFAAGDDVIVINADNDYPVEALSALQHVRGGALIGFTRDGLLRGNITADRLAGYALVLDDGAGRLREVMEKPTAAQLAELAPHTLISMTCWRFTPAIFTGCRAIGPSARGEYELTDAVRYTVSVLGQTFRIVSLDAPVLDLSVRADIPAVARLLAGRSVDL